jgi:hypothetical protein
LRTLLFCYTLEGFKPAFQYVDDHFVSEHYFDLLVEIDEIADETDDLSGDGVVLIAGYF